MCGICGKIDSNAHQGLRKTVQVMSRKIAHRGPDAEGVFVDRMEGGGAVALGHQRLSVIDLSENARQPIGNEDGTLWIVFNGEIYNFRELRDELNQRGHRFKSESDTEVILHLYEEEGFNCLDRLNGMFAFALWDRNKESLWLCRDRLGIKPLVYACSGKNLSFSSEIKSLIADPGVSKEMDPEAIGLYLSLNYIPAPWTIFKQIRKLEPGHYLVFANGRLEKRRYWRVPQPGAEAAAAGDAGSIQKTLFRLTRQAVERRLISDVPLGAFLSGGIDSSIVVGLMAQATSRKVKTFSIGYKDLPFYDETGYAREVAAFHGTDHHEFRLDCKDVLEVIPEVLDDFDEPFADSSAIPTYIVSRETRRKVTVALSGDGADELFAGYRKYSGEFWYRYYSLLPKQFRASALKPLFSKLPKSRNSRAFEYVRRADKFVQGACGSQAHRIWAWREIFSREVVNDLLEPDAREKICIEKARELTAEGLQEFPADAINRMLHLDATTSLPDDMLTKVDRMSMRHALEVRVPFLDHELVEFVFSIPGRLKLRRATRKYILIETFRSLLPSRIWTRPKWGFEVPISAWMKTALRPYLDRYLSRECLRRQGIFDPEAVHRLVSAHASGRQEWGWQLWNLIVFGHWYETYYEPHR